MNDIEIWQRLVRGDGRDDSSLLADLRALSDLDTPRRCAFYGLVEPLAAHDEPAVREAAVAFLRGVQGMVGLGRLVEALADADARVLDAALDSLRASSVTQPSRWAHVIFHPRTAVRAAALRLGGPRGAEHLGTYLRTDPDNAALARQSPWPKQALSLAADLFDREAASAPELCDLVVATPPAELAPFVATGRADLLDVMLRAASRHPTARRDVCEALARAALRRRQADARQRLVDALLRCKPLGPDAVALASVLDMRVLARGAVAGDALAALAWWLWRLREPAPKISDEKRLAELLALPAFRDADGTPRLSLAAALCGLFPGAPLRALVRFFGEGAVVDTLCARPDHWDALCRLPPETPSEARRLLAVIGARDRAVWRRLAAGALARWSSGQQDACVALLASIADDELGDVVEAFVRHVGGLDDKAAAKAVSTLGALLLARANGAVAVLEPIFERLLPLADPDGNRAGQLVHALMKAMLEADLARLARRLPPPLQLHLVRLFESAYPLAWAQELAIAAVLKGAWDEQVRRWAARLIQGAGAQPPTARPTIKAVRTIAGDEARRIATCAEADLEEALASALAGPSLGLCATLRARPDPDAPALSVCVALVGCGDALPEVHEAVERFAGTDAGFLSNLDNAVVTMWQGNVGLPPFGNAWLHRWEQHAFALASWLEKEDIPARFAELAALPAGLVRQELWEAFGHVALLFRYRDRPRLGPWASVEVLDVVLAALGEPDSAGVARVLVALVEAGYLGAQGPRIRQRILEVAPDLDKDTRTRLSALARFEGIPEVARRAAGEKPPPGTVDEVRRSTDPDVLLRVCREANRTLVAEALLRLLDLGPAAGPAFRILAREWPGLPCPVPIAESISLWTDEAAIAVVRGLVADPSLGPEARFRAARGLVERGEAAFVEDALVAAIVEDASSWFRPADWSILVRHADPTTCARALVQSPHPHAYQNAVEHLLGQPPSPQIFSSLRDFLARGTQRPLHLRRTVARLLAAYGDTFGIPVIADHLLDHREELAVDLVALLPREALDALADALTASALIAGDTLVGERRIVQLAASGLLADAVAQRIFMRLLEHGTNAAARADAARRARPGPARDAKLGALARTFAWGVRRGRDLTGRLFRIHMTPKRQDLGYTFLTESRIFVSPLPILRGDNHAEAIVEGLILHELGHHRYHTGEEAAQLWARAHKEGIGPLLNLVADEHLERNLRALDATHGDRLKRLGAHAFLHASREVAVQELLDSLLGAACEVLTAARLGVAHDPASVAIESGPLLRALSNAQGSFARFIRALRLGQGNRWNDPLVGQALAYFDAGFRRLDMAGLYEVATAVARLFGGSAAVAALFGGHESIPWSEQEGQRHGDSITDEQVQREVERILDPRQADGAPRRSGRPDRFALNVNPKEEFDRIERVERLPYDPAKHRPLAVSVRRHSMRLRDFLARLGRALATRRARLRGRAFDRTRVRAVVTRGDPRMLVAREIQDANDIFVGTVIDCSSSMSAFDNIEKAKRFGVLVAEAVRDLPGVEARFFGFNESVIFDAGDHGRCAVTSLEAGGGNNDAAALYHAARVAAGSARRTRVLIMISDGLPTDCSVAALRALVTNLGRRGFVCAQVAVHPLEEVCFPSYVVLDEKNMEASVARFGELIMKLVTRGRA